MVRSASSPPIQVVPSVRGHPSPTSVMLITIVRLRQAHWVQQPVLFGQPHNQDGKAPACVLPPPPPIQQLVSRDRV